MMKNNFKNVTKSLLIVINFFCVGVVTYIVIKGDFENSKTIQSLAIFVWLQYLTGDFIKKFTD